MFIIKYTIIANDMITTERYNELKELCDRYFEIDAELDNLIELYNKSSIEDFRNGLLPQISKKIKELDKAGETYVTEVNDEAAKLVEGIDLQQNFLIKRAYSYATSNLDSHNDSSRYNRLNRLKELDEIVEIYKSQNP